MNSQEATTQYVHAGRWTLCVHCRTGYVLHATHYCGAPWQVKPPDWPEGWKVGEPDGAALVRERDFIRRIVTRSLDGGDVDGGEIHDWAIKAGILVPTIATEPCDPESCRCAEYDAMFPTTCYRWAERFLATHQRGG
jgi:hypothetical protein